jgi:hypothetical protein
MNTQNNRRWSIDNLHFIHEITLYNVKACGWYTLSASDMQKLTVLDIVAFRPIARQWPQKKQQYSSHY